MTHLPDSDLRELEGLLAKATPGPWRYLSPTQIWAAEFVGQTMTPPDGRLIVAAVNVLPNLLSDLREAREAIGAFVAKYEECEPHITGAFQMAFTVRGHQYTGPNYAAELARLRELARIKELEGKT